MLTFLHKIEKSMRHKLKKSFHFIISASTGSITIHFPFVVAESVCYFILSIPASYNSSNTKDCWKKKDILIAGAKPIFEISHFDEKSK